VSFLIDVAEGQRGEHSKALLLDGVDHITFVRTTSGTLARPRLATLPAKPEHVAGVAFPLALLTVFRTYAVRRSAVMQATASALDRVAAAGVAGAGASATVRSDTREACAPLPLEERGTVASGRGLRLRREGKPVANSRGGS
jgi:hypothetical protein